MDEWKFASASALFNELKEQYPDDLAAEFYTWRSNSYIQDPPPPNWDGVSNLTEK